MRPFILSFFVCCFFLPFFSFGEEPINRSQISYLMQKNDYLKSLELYDAYRKKEKKHDFEILQQLGTLLLEKGGESSDPETQLLTLYGSAYANITSALKVIEAALSSQHLQTQLAAIQLLGHLDDDRCPGLLNIAMSSNFFYTRMEAAFQLCLRKDRSAVGQIEALMHRVPPPLRPYFPPFFGLIGNREGIRMLRRLLNDKDPSVRIEAILSCAKNGRDDLLPLIRTLSTHLNPIEQETCSFALGALQDSDSLPLLKKLSQSLDSNVSLSASFSAFKLGRHSAKEAIVELAKKENLFALHLLGDIPGSENVLLPHLYSKSLHVRLNTALSLLKLRDPRVVNALKEFLIHDSKDFGFYTYYSPGKAFMVWKVLPSALQHQKESSFDIVGLSVALREMILKQCLELPEEAFLQIAAGIFASNQTELVPMLISLLENLRTPDALALLKVFAQKRGLPLIRAYCNLSLFRLNEKGPYEHAVKQWLINNMGKDLIRFRPIMPSNIALSNTRFDLTPEERSRLLFESCEVLSLHQSEGSIDLILEMIKKGNPKNRYALAGLLLKTIQ